MTAITCASLLGAAVLLVLGRRVRLPSAIDAVPVGPADEAALLLRLRIPLCGLAFVAGWAFLGGVIGVLGGGLAVALSWRILGSAESPASRRRRDQLERDLPVGVQLLGACLTAGGSTTPALGLVADALPGPLADEFRRLHHRLELGVDPVVVWREVAADPHLGALGRALGRAHQSGASVADAVAALSGELRARSRAQVEERARSVDVRAAAPLGVCFLPAFVLLGVVPLVVGIFSSMALFD